MTIQTTSRRRGGASRVVTALALGAVVTLAVAAPMPGDDDAPSVREPEVPAALAAKGVTYHTIHGKQAQVTFTSRAPLEDIVGKSNAVVGYAVATTTAASASIHGATWLLPVNSLATGIPLRDEHLADAAWLDAGAHPTIRFTLQRTEEVELVKSGDGYSTWDATLVGTMTLHGVERTVRVPKARLSFLAESERTRRIADGDLLFIKCAYDVAMSEYGITHRDVPEKVSDVIHLEQMLRLSTEPQLPEARPGA